MKLYIGNVYSQTHVFKAIMLISKTCLSGKGEDFKSYIILHSKKCKELQHKGEGALKDITVTVVFLNI